MGVRLMLEPEKQATLIEEVIPDMPATVTATNQAAIPTTLALGAGATNKSNNTTSVPDRGTVGKNDFMKLLLTQLRSQNPLKPMDNSEFTSQLVQFQPLQKLEDLDKNLAAMLDLQQLSQASSLIGKQVEGVANDGPKVSGVVTEVSIVNGVAVLKLGDKTLDLHKVTRVSEASK